MPVIPLLILLMSVSCSLPLIFAQDPPTATVAAAGPVSATANNTPQVKIEATTPAKSPAQATLTRPAEASTADLALQPDPLDFLLNLRSIKFNLSTQRPDGTTRSIEGEIDSSGNLHLKITDPAYDTSGMPKDFTAGKGAPQTELFVLGGKAYLPDALEPAWKTTPIDEQFGVNFSKELHGMDGPALWLNLLPVGSVTADGSEQVGGFAAKRYKVAGTVSGSKIIGTIWKDPQSNALVQAELHIPAALLNSPQEPGAGEMVITLNAQKADVKAITLPQ
jgi:hypothetical protein